jgi:hypothetical protein
MGSLIDKYQRIKGIYKTAPIKKYFSFVGVIWALNQDFYLLIFVSK